MFQKEHDIPFFGQVFLFSMNCSSCKFSRSDVECLEEHGPSRYTFEVCSSDDMCVRVVKSSQATVKIPGIVTITPGVVDSGYVSNVEGVLRRVERRIENSVDSEDSVSAKKSGKKHLRKIREAIEGVGKLKIIIEDPSGNSSIVSDRAVVEKLKVRKK